MEQMPECKDWWEVERAINMLYSEDAHLDKDWFYQEYVTSNPDP